MKYTFWSAGIIIAGLCGIAFIVMFQDITINNESEYYVLKEAMEASMLESIDWACYRIDEDCRENDIKMSEQKFVENFTRRYAESISGSVTEHTIEFYDIMEMPPKATVVIKGKTKNFGVLSEKEEEVTFDLTNNLSGILEATGLESKIKTCETFTNYYFMSTVVTKDEHISNMLNNNIWEFSATVSYPSLKETLKYKDIIIDENDEITINNEYIICLTRGTDDSMCDSIGVEDNSKKWSLQKFFIKYLKLSNIETPNVGEITKAKGYTFSNNVYLTHINANVKTAQGKMMNVDLTTEQINELASNLAKSAAVLPFELNVGIEEGSNPIDGNVQIGITRKVKNEGNEQIGGVSLDWELGGNSKNTPLVFSPALYAIEYDFCEVS